MINLLPKEDRVLMKKEYLRRLLVLVGIFCFSFICIAILLLLPSYFLAISQRKTFENRLKAGAESLNRQDMPAIEAEVVGLNAKLAFFAGQQDETQLSKIIERIAENRGKNILLTYFSYQKGKESGNDIFLLQGRALTRKDFLSFVESLRKMEEIKNIESPPSNLLKTENILFVLNLELTLSGLKSQK